MSINFKSVVASLLGAALFVSESLFCTVAQEMDKILKATEVALEVGSRSRAAKALSQEILGTVASDFRIRYLETDTPLERAEKKLSHSWLKMADVLGVMSDTCQSAISEDLVSKQKSGFKSAVELSIYFIVESELVKKACFDIVSALDRQQQTLSGSVLGTIALKLADVVLVWDIFRQMFSEIMRQECAAELQTFYHETVDPAVDLNFGINGVKGYAHNWACLNGLFAELRI